MILHRSTASPSSVARIGHQADNFKLRTKRDLSDHDHGEGAIALYERALERDPTNHLLLFDLARAYAVQNRRHDAERLLARVVQLYPQSSTVRFKAAKLYRRINRPISAIKHFRQALELDPHHPQATEMLVEMSTLAGWYGTDRRES